MTPTAPTHAVPCQHCGLPAPAPEDPETPAFCCPGCRAVYQRLSEAGLCDFYALRDRMGEAASGVQGEWAVGDAAYAHYDDAAIFPQAASEETGTAEATLHVSNVHCTACVWLLERLTEVVPGVVRSRLDLGRRRLHVSWDPTRVKLSQVGAYLHGIGYPTHPLGGAAEEAKRREVRTRLIRLAVAFACAGNIMLVAIAGYAGEGEMEHSFDQFFRWVSLLLALPAVTWAAWPFYRGALAGLRVGVAHMDLPISLGLLGGFSASAYATVVGDGPVYFDSVATLVFLLLLGRYLQSRGEEAAMDSADLMHALTPGSTRRLEDGRWVPRAVAALVRGDRVRVENGERFPVDGALAGIDGGGRAHADLSLLTGESRPVELEVGGPVFAGTTNVARAVEVEVHSTGGATRIGRLLEMTETATDRRAPVVRLADRISGWFVSAVIGLAALSGAIWWQVDPSMVFQVVVALLVVSCPCALGLATPMAVTVARGRAAATGLLVRTPDALERLAQARRVVLDKTGTLTEGRMSVEDAWFDGPVPHAWIAALESRSRHPLAQAIVQWAGPTPHEAEAVEEVAGRGIVGRVSGHELRLGNPALVDAGAFASRLITVARSGRTPVLVEVDGRTVGLLAVGDRLRADTEEAVARLKAMGLALAIRSGDHPEVVAGVAARLGLDDAEGATAPEAKADAVADGGGTIMVGDGVNDAPALRSADVGVAVYGGAEAALAVADVYATREGLLPLVELIEGARRTMRTIRRNLVFSLLYNVLFASLAIAGYITPLAAAILMPISSLTVVASSVFARTFDRGRDVPAPGAAPSPEALAETVPSTP